MRSEPTRKELLISIRSFLEDLNLEVFPNAKKHIDTLININETDDSKSNNLPTITDVNFLNGKYYVIAGSFSNYNLSLNKSNKIVTIFPQRRRNT